MATALRLPADLAAYLARFDMSLDGLLTTTNPKLAKGATLAHVVILHHLPGRALAAAIRPQTAGTIAPRGYLPGLAAIAAVNGLSTVAGRWDGCPWATDACRQGCLNWSGHGGLSADVAAARGRRTLAMLANPATYARCLVWAVAREYARARSQGLPLAVRLRGTDEGPRIGWHRLWFDLPDSDVAAIARRFGMPLVGGTDTTMGEVFSLVCADETMHLYDYSKAPLSGPLGLIAQSAAGWDLTASFAADRATAVADGAAALRAGFRLAVPVRLRKGEPLPVALTLTPANGAPFTVPAVDGDASDHRWADPHGVAVILRTKLSRGATAAADPFSLSPVATKQRLADGMVRLSW